MRISVDAGALSVPKSAQFGTAIVTENVLRALPTDQENTYTAYLYRKTPRNYTPAPSVRYAVLRPSLGWMALRVSLEEIIHPSDLYLGLNQAIPWYTKAKVVTLLHGLSFFYHKELYPDSYEALKDQVLFAISRSDRVVVPSVRVKNELEEQFGFDRAEVHTFGVPYEFERAQSKTRLKNPFFLFVGMHHPIKNIQFIIDAFTIFKQHHAHKNFELYLVGNHERYHNPDQGIVSKKVDRAELVKLYGSASGYLTASHYESCNLPVIESLAAQTPVVGRSSAVIPELRDFVMVADKLEDFVEAMNRSSSQTVTKMQRAKLLQDFSWKKFTEALLNE